MKRIFLSFGLMSLLVAACGRDLQSANVREQFDAETIQLGQTVYIEQCASCHGDNLEGQPNRKEPNPDGSFRAPPHDATGHTWHHGDATLLNAVLDGGARLAEMNLAGVSNMPAYEAVLTEEEVVAVLEYIKSTWPEDIQAMQADATEREAAQRP